jgi:hypothetical protein
MKYGGKPEVIGTFDIDCKEMMFYMYLPIKMIDSLWIEVPKSLEVFRPLIDAVLEHEMKHIEQKYIYITAKHIYATPDNVGNRAGYHSDGFLTDDINYIWTNKFPTVFCIQDFNISTDCALAMHQMEHQADKDNEVRYPENTLLKLDQGVIHRTPTIRSGGMRTFVKISVSSEKYNLVGNSHNHLLDYNWKMYDRSEVRNHPTHPEKDYVK